MISFHFKSWIIYIHCTRILFIDKISCTENLKIYQEVKYKNRGYKLFREEIENFDKNMEERKNIEFMVKKKLKV
jgi:hypothetical protein